MITLIGKELAKEGVSFIFYESAEECSTCRFKASCVDSLKEGHRYTITEVRDVEQKCPIHENDKVQVVSVENAEFTILTDSRKRSLYQGFGQIQRLSSWKLFSEVSCKDI